MAIDALTDEAVAASDAELEASGYFEKFRQKAFGMTDKDEFGQPCLPKEVGENE